MRVRVSSATAWAFEPGQSDVVSTTFRDAYDAGHDTDYGGD